MNARASARSLVPMLAACSAVLVAGFCLQLLAYRHGGHESISDVPRLVLGRHLSPGHWPVLDRAFEYPVLAAVLLGAAVTVASGPLGALVVVAAGASLVTLVITWVLGRRVGGRAWRWALATPVLLYAFQNWDLFAIAALLVGLLAYERGRDAVAGAAFGIGAAIKLFPLVVVPPLAALRWVHGDHRGARRLVGSALATLAITNLPFVFVNARNWWWTYSFQSARQATWGSVWFYAFRLAGLPVHGPAGAQLANMVTLLALAGGLTWLVVRSVHHELPALAAAAAAVTICLLSNKVYSPTYDVWLVVFFVLLPLGRRLWIAFCLVDLAIFAVVYGYFVGPLSIDIVRSVLPVLVILRVAVLVTIVKRTTEPRPRVPARDPMRVPVRAGSL